MAWGGVGGGTRPLDAQGIRRIYDRLARLYDFLELPSEVLLGLRRCRRELVAKARGDVLEVGIGTGKNLPYYPPGCRLTGVDLSPAMLERAARRAARLGRTVVLLPMDAERLEFPDRSFDTVLSTLSLCTIPDPVRALREMGRVCRPGGRILLLDHVRSRVPWIGRLQDRLTPGNVRRLGCHLNRDSEALARAAGLEVRRVRRHRLGIVALVEAGPAWGPAPG